MDVLTDVLDRSRARGAAFAQTTVRGECGLAFDAGAGLAVHAIVAGEVWMLTDDDDDARRLGPGDVVVVNGKLSHRLASSPDAPCRRVEDLLAGQPLGERARQAVVGEVGAPLSAQFFCGAFLFDGDLCGNLLASLPDVLHLRPPSGSALRTTIDLLAAELLVEAPGQQTLLDRLLDVALVQIVRQHLADDSTMAPSWLRASTDPTIGPALRAMHADPAHGWSLSELAALVALSRAAFARRFTALLGVAPMTYLADWRMAIARERLREGDDGLAAVARDVGYSSEFAFSAAFKRRYGEAPGRWRRAARTESPVATN